MGQIQTRNTVNMALSDLNIPPKEQIPRIRIDLNTVQRYAELMGDGYDSFPPIEVWRKPGKDGGREWWIVRGIHWYMAALVAGKESFPCQVQEFPEEEFPVRALNANLKYVQLSRHDMKRAIIDAWVKDGIRDVNKIADLIGNAWTPQYIKKVLKPLRDQERKELEAKAWELREQGLTQAEIAKEVGMSRGWVSDTLQMKSGNRNNLSVNHLLKVGDLVALFQVKSCTIRYWIKKYKIPVIKIGKHIYLKPDTVNAFLDKVPSIKPDQQRPM